VPLCPNCHAMVHRTRGRIMAVTELKSLIEAQRQPRR
jgi:predicted HNH restriction endonuclease